MNKTSDKRENWIDWLKAIGVLLIVFHHAGIPIFNTYHYYVVVFFIVSGYLFHDVSIKDYLVNKIKRLYIPFIIVNISAILIHNLFYVIGIIGDYYTFNEIIINSIKALMFNVPDLLCAPTWFIFALFVVGLCYLFLFKVAKIFGKYQDLAIIFASSVMFVIGCLYKNLFASITYANCSIITIIFVSMIFMTFGYLIKKYKIRQYVDSNDKVRLLIIVASIVCLLLINSVFEFNLDYRTGQFNSAKLFILASISGYVVLSRIPMILIKSNAILVKMFNYLGKHTLTILLWHGIFFNVITIFQVLLFNTPISSIHNWCNFYNVGYWRYFGALIGIIGPVGILYLYDIIKTIIKPKYKRAI